MAQLVFFPFGGFWPPAFFRSLDPQRKKDSNPLKNPNLKKKSKQRHQLEKISL